MSTPPPRLFVSHSHTDHEFSVRLVEDLRRVLGDESAVWYDARGGLKGGDAWWRTIVQEITSRSVFLVVLSTKAMESPWVQDEIDLAWRERNSPRRMRIIPLLRHACAIRPDLRSLHIIDFQPSRDYNMTLQELLSALGVGKPQASQQPTSQPERNLLSRMMPQVEAAFTAQDWPDVIRKSAYLLKHSSEDIPASLYHWYGLALQQQGQFQQAQGALEMALVLVTEREQRLHMLQSYADLLIGQERWDEVLPLAHEALRLMPNDPNWSQLQELAQAHGKTKQEWFKQGNAHHASKEYEKAIADYDRAIALDPNDANAYHNRGLAYRNINEYHKAIADYDRAIALDPDYRNAYHNRGLTYYNLNEYQKAIADYDRAIALDPNFALAKENRKQLIEH